MVDWESTDQFGNLTVGYSGASSLEELRPELEDLLERLQDRAPGHIVVTIDLEYGQINGPQPDQVSHVLNVPLLGMLQDGGMPADDIVNTIREVLGMDALVVLAE